MLGGIDPIVEALQTAAQEGSLAEGEETEDEA